MDTRIYVAAHKIFKEPKEKIYIPLHVGREGKSDLGYIGDHTGEHISEKNSNYCELTGMYWMWKNVSCDIIGLCHYRRYFEHDGVLLSQDYIEQTLADYDLILGSSSMSEHGSAYAHYDYQHISNDLNTCGQVLKEMYPQYGEAFDFVLKSNLMSLGNMMICRKQLFDEYCSWLFPLLFKVEEQTDLSSYDSYQKRLYGFLAERLLRVWVVMQEVRVLEEKIVQTE